MASVERYDPSVVKREMSKKKVYAFDGGMVSAIHFSTSADRGKYLENFVFSHLRRMTFKIFFLKTGGAECDFIVDIRGKVQCIQVCQEVTATNINRELKGLQRGMQAVGVEGGYLFVNPYRRASRCLHGAMSKKHGDGGWNCPIC